MIYVGTITIFFPYLNMILFQFRMVSAVFVIKISLSQRKRDFLAWGTMFYFPEIFVQIQMYR